jgi:hypothetical protein
MTVTKKKAPKRSPGFDLMYEASIAIKAAREARKALEFQIEQHQQSKSSSEAGLSEEHLDAHEAEYQRLLQALEVARHNEKIAHERSDGAWQIYEALKREDTQLDRAMAKFYKDSQKWWASRVKDFLK